MTESLQGFSAPSIQDAKSYYYGLFGSLSLIARTSTTPILPHYEWPPRKFFANLSGHEIVLKWNPTLRDDLVKALEADSEFTWDTFYPIRIGSNEEEFRRIHPVILVVGVRPDV